MATIVTRAGKGSALSHNEVDANFTNLNSDKLEANSNITVADATVTGDLTVQGTTTTLNTATLQVEDKNITLNYATGDSSGSADGAGITIQDAVSSSTDATILWDATNDTFDFSHAIQVQGLVDIASGEIGLKNSGSVSNIKFYCEVSNAHYTALQSSPHSAYSGNVTLTLPPATDTLVGRATTDTLTNKTLTSPVLTGNVGIGTASPNFSLEVQGSSNQVISIQTTGTTDNTQLRFGDADNSDQGKVNYDHSVDAMTLHTSDAERVRIDSSGNVGIGGDGNAKLEVFGPLASPSLGTYANSAAIISTTAGGYGMSFSVDGTGTGYIQAQNFTSSTAYNLSLNSAGGNVGIGTTSPDGLLHLRKDTTDGIAQVLYQNDARQYNVGLNGLLSDSWIIYDNTAAATRFVLDTSGNVGIGDSSPAQALVVKRSTGHTYLDIARATQSQGQVALQLSGGTGGTNWVIYQHTSSNDLRFYGNGSNHVVIDSSGNTTLNGKLSITDSAYDNHLELNRSSEQWRFSPSTDGSLDIRRIGGTGTARLDILSNTTIDGSLTVGDGTNAADHIAIKPADDGTADDLQFYNGTTRVGEIGTQDTSWLRINQSTAKNIYTPRYIRSDGGLFVSSSLYGINSGGQLTAVNGSTITGTADCLLKVITTGTSSSHDAILRLQIGGNTGDSIIQFGDTDDADVGRIAYHHNGNTMRFFTNGAEDMRLLSGGSLHVDGDVVAYSTTISDERLKDDVQDIKGALDTVDALRGVTYTWNSGSREGKRDYGVIAQEVEQVIPEIVYETEMPLLGDEETLYKTVDYEKLCAVLINAVSELRAEVEALKNGAAE